MLPFRRLAALPLCLLSITLAGCEVPQFSESPTAPRVEGPLRSEASVEAEYTLVEGLVPSSIADLSASKLIGAEGGSVHLAGHSIAVPAGAVGEPAVFTLTLLTNGLVEVDIKAVAADLGGADVGEKGFAKPVTLSLTYGWASNVSDPGKLLIVRRLGEDRFEPLKSTVSSTGKTVTALLDHFSAYCLATN